MNGNAGRNPNCFLHKCKANGLVFLIGTFLWRYEGMQQASVANPFKDVYEGAYYYSAVLWAVKQKITTGTSGNTFSPKRICNRAQCVTFLYREFGQTAD